MSAVKKRKPGRPKGSTNKKTTTTATEVKIVKRGPGRPKGVKNKGPKSKPVSVKPTAKKATAKKPAAKKSVKEVKSPKSKRGGATRETNPDTGFSIGTDSDKIAKELLKGSTSRQGVIDVMRKKLDSETRNGTEKPVPNMVAGVLNKLLDQGYRVEESFKLLPPTPASKRAATKRRNGK